MASIYSAGWIFAWHMVATRSEDGGGATGAVPPRGGGGVVVAAAANYRERGWGGRGHSCHTVCGRICAREETRCGSCGRVRRRVDLMAASLRGWGECGGV